MKKTLLLYLMGLLLCNSSYSQSETKILQEWSTIEGTQNFFQKNIVKTHNNEVYIAGATMNGAGNYDILVAKYDDKGDALWKTQISGSANYHDFATGLFISDSGFVYVTGAITNDSVNLFSDIITLKLKGNNGSTLWSQTYDGAGYYDSGTDIKFFDGDVYVTGSGFNSNVDLDYIALKYNASGVQQWVSSYDYNALNDSPVKCIVSDKGMLVLGVGQSTSTDYDALTVEFDLSTGGINSTSTNTGGTAGVNLVNDMAVDWQGNIFVAGGVPTVSDGYDFYLAKLDSNLVLQWEATFDEYNGDNVLNAVAVDTMGFVYVTGYSIDSNAVKGWVTMQYDQAGYLQHEVGYTDGFIKNSEASALLVDQGGRYITVTGYNSSANHKDFYTIRYDDAFDVIWEVGADGYGLDDKATALAFDDEGDIIVTGQSKKNDGTYEYKTIKYVQKQIITPTDYNSETPTFSYYENKGQLLNTNDTLIPDVRYYTTASTPAYYIGNKNLSFILAHVDTASATTDTIQRTDLNFTGAKVNSSAKVYPMETQEEYINYFLGHTSKGITGIHGNKRLVTSALYSNIDLEYSSNQNGLKYYFIIKQGGDPTDINMEFAGAASYTLNGTTHALTINSPIGNITFDRPTVYQLSSTNVVIPITGWNADWQTNGATNKYKFNIGTYNHDLTLVIEVDMGNAASCTPQISYKNIRLSSYYGGTNQDHVNSVAVDTAGNVFYAGDCTGQTFPLASGLYTSNAVNNTIGLLSKFNSYGTQLYATYYGGNGGTTYIYGITTNAIGEPTTVGFSASTNLQIAHNGGQYYQAASGFNDGIVARWTTNGMGLLWSARFGGTAGDALNDVVIKGSETFVVGRGTETSPHVIKTGAYNSPTTPSGQKGVIAHFNANDSLVWSTFIGGEIKDVDYSSNLIGIGGLISTNNLPFSKTVGTYVDTTYGGATDAFLSILNVNDSINWAAYYGGTQFDVCNSVKFDRGPEGNPPNLYATGTTASSVANGFLTYDPGNGAYFNGTYHGNKDAVYWKFSNTGARLWASYYGTGTQASSVDNGRDVVVDKYNNVYFCGETSSQLENIQFLSGANAWYTQNYTGSSLASQGFIFAVGKSLKPFWATNFGGQLTEWASKMATDGKNDYLYLGGNTATNSNAIGFPAYRPSSYTGWYSCESASPSYDDGYFSQFKIADANVVGITEHEQENLSSLLSYPNPFSDEITFNFNAEGSKNYTIEIYNTLGQIIYSITEKVVSNTVSKTIEFEGSKGLYYVQVRLLNRTLASKIIKQ